MNQFIFQMIRGLIALSYRKALRHCESSTRSLYHMSKQLPPHLKVDVGHSDFGQQELVCKSNARSIMRKQLKSLLQAQNVASCSFCLSQSVSKQ